MTVNLYIYPECIAVSFKNFREVFPRPLDYDAVQGKLKKLPPGVKAICTVCSRRTAIRIAPYNNERITTEWVHGRFPYGEKFNEKTHEFSYEIFKPSVVFMAAASLTVLDEVCEICESLKIKKNNIKQIDVIERRLFAKYSGESVNRWVCFPFPNGVRILTISGGLPENAHTVSNDPAYRNSELSRIILPEEAVVFDGCDWLKEILAASNVGITHGGRLHEAF